MPDNVETTQSTRETRINTCHHCGKYDWACAEGIRLRLQALARQPHYLGKAVLAGTYEYDTQSCLVSQEWYDKLSALLKIVR